jgi:hypothetical protein
VSSVMERLRRRIPLGRRRVPDPFATLELQLRLGRLSRELDALASPRERSFAAGHHVRAAEIAYDRSLADACELIGEAAPTVSGPTNRLYMEAALTKAGWTW